MCRRGCCDRVRCEAEPPVYRNRTLRYSQGRCPSSRRCRSRETHSQGLLSQASTFPATDHSHEPRRYHWPWAELLQTRQRNPCQLRRPVPGSCGGVRHSSPSPRESERFAAEKGSDSIAVAPWFTFAVQGRTHASTTAGPRPDSFRRFAVVWPSPAPLPLYAPCVHTPWKVGSGPRHPPPPSSRSVREGQRPPESVRPNSGTCRARDRLRQNPNPAWTHS